MLKDIKDDTSAILPAALHMVEPSPHYAFTVTCTSSAGGDALMIPCQKVLALVKSSKSSKSITVGSGFKLVTPEVVDVLAPLLTNETTDKSYTLSSMCTLDNLPQYRLDPPRGGSQHALVTITAKTPDAFIVESVQLLKEEEAEKASQSLLRMLYYAMHLYGRDRKRAAEWSEDFSPSVARKCKRVGRYPSDVPLDSPYQICGA